MSKIAELKAAMTDREARDKIEFVISVPLKNFMGGSPDIEIAKALRKVADDLHRNGLPVTALPITDKDGHKIGVYKTR